MLMYQKSMRESSSVVERLLAKEKVGGSTPLSRSTPCIVGGLSIVNHGVLAEWLGRGLQNPVRRFNSATRLHNKASFNSSHK